MKHMNAQREGDKAAFKLLVGGGSHGDTNENMVGDILSSKKVGYPTKPTNLDLWSGNHIPLYPQCPQMYSGTKKNVFNISWKNHWDNESERALHTLNWWSSDLDVHLNQLEGLLKQVAEPHPPCFWSGRLKWSLRICVFNKFSHDADAAIPETTLWEPWL